MTQGGFIFMFPDNNRAASMQQLMFMSNVTQALQRTDRSIRKMVAEGRFPPADGNLNGRNFWFLDTYHAWLSDVAAGKYARKSHLSGGPAAA